MSYIPFITLSERFAEYVIASDVAWSWSQVAQAAMWKAYTEVNYELWKLQYQVWKS